MEQVVEEVEQVLGAFEVEPVFDVGHVVYMADLEDDAEQELIERAARSARVAHAREARVAVAGVVELDVVCKDARQLALDHLRHKAGDPDVRLVRHEHQRRLLLLDVQVAQQRVQHWLKMR